MGFMKKIFHLGEAMESIDAHKYGDKMEEVGLEISQGADVLKLAGVALEAESLGIATPIVEGTEVVAEVASEVGNSLSFIGGGINFVGDTMNKTGKFLETISSVKKNTPKRFETHACVAKNAYGDDKDCGNDMEFNKDLSIDKLDVYTDGKDTPEDLYIGIEGTNFKSKGILNDLYDDSQILGNNIENTSTFKRLNEHMHKLKKLHPNAKIHIGSHSLGGAIAKALNCHHKFDSNVTFNAGEVPHGNKCEKKSEITNITTGRDLISVSNIIPKKNEKTIIVKGKKGFLDDPLFHSMEFF